MYVYDDWVESPDERRTQRTLGTMLGFTLVALGAVWTIYGATLSGSYRVVTVAMGIVPVVGGLGLIFIVRTPRVADVDRRRVIRLWTAGLLVALGLAGAIAGATLAVPVEIAVGIVAMLFGGGIAYVAARGRSPRPQSPDRPDS